ncbi:MAG: ribosome biogenesis GTPase Der, partial [Desulfobacterales bacterium]|nr:ribosome biogenesis GTPase Der [Desulfobacterales bacterium]
LLRRSNKTFFLAVNKVDGVEQEHLLSDFYSLGVDKVYPLSAAHGYGLRDLMDDVTEGLSGPDTRIEDDYKIRVAILGRPNAGKSSLINRILGSERLLVSEVPGTTRDAVDILVTFQGKEYLFIDTAGLKRKARVKEKIEKFSMIKTLRSLERCHLAVILLDGKEGIADQDARICGYAFERGRGIIFGVNKWDLIKHDLEAKKQIEKGFDRQLKFAAYAPRINLSALTGEGVNKLFGKIDLLYEQFDRRISTGVVNRALEEMIKKRPPPKSGRGRLKFFYATQTAVRPPTFVLFVNNPEMVHFSYQRFLMNQLRSEFNLGHTPIRLKFNKK